MRKLKNLLCVLLCFSLLLGLAGCADKAPAASKDEAASVATETPAEPPAADLYTQAVQSLKNTQKLELDLNTKKSITTDAETIQLVSDQELILTGIGTAEFSASLTEQLEVGEYSDQFTEYYENGTLFVNVANAGRFQGNLTQEDFLARFAPAVLLDETLYATIQAEEKDNSTTLTFADPTGPESWALPEGAQFISASGSAKITNGILTRSTYTIDYLLGSTSVSMEIAVKTEIYDGDALTAPPEPANYVKIDNIEAPRLYDTAILHLYNAENASASLNQTIISQAASYTLTTQTAMHYSGIGQNHVSDLQYTASAVDESMSVETFSQTEHFQDGVYTYSEANGTPEPDASVTAADMRNYLQGYYSDNLPALQYIQSMTAEDLGGLIYLEMELNEKWGQSMADYTAGIIFQDEQFLNNYASAYQTHTGTYYMALDSATGFPLSAATTFAGIHTIDGADYVLGMELNQTYRLADPTTYEEITGTPLTEEAPETQATPLLYRVSGTEGQEMYLMGTIHAGDARTAYLPDEVYDALEASDTLAVEADVVAFEEETAKNPELAAQVAAAYVNTDGTATKDLLDGEVYNKAVKLLKASGNYNTLMETMKPYLWSNTIDNFYLTLGRLHTDKGLDMRLLKLAKEQGKQIQEIESTLSQLDTLSNLSMDLQVMLLEESAGYTVAEFCQEVQELYELWCAGDEAALRTHLAEDTSDLTADEQLLYKEYMDTVIIQRNTHMLDAATDCLDSGDTVFFAVGLAHLLQENGLVDTLRDAGYTVEQVKYS